MFAGKLSESLAVVATIDPATIANVLAAVAAGWALGVTYDAISTGIKTYGLELPDPSALLAQLAKKPRKPAARN